MPCQAQTMAQEDPPTTRPLRGQGAEATHSARTWREGHMLYISIPKTASSSAPHLPLSPSCYDSPPEQGDALAAAGSNSILLLNWQPGCVRTVVPMQ